MNTYWDFRLFESTMSTTIRGRLAVLHCVCGTTTAVRTILARYRSFYLLVLATLVPGSSLYRVCHLRRHLSLSAPRFPVRPRGYPYYSNKLAGEPPTD